MEMFGKVVYVVRHEYATCEEVEFNEIVCLTDNLHSARLARDIAKRAFDLNNKRAIDFGLEYDRWIIESFLMDTIYDNDEICPEIVEEIS